MKTLQKCMTTFTSRILMIYTVPYYNTFRFSAYIIIYIVSMLLYFILRIDTNLLSNLAFKLLPNITMRYFKTGILRLAAVRISNPTRCHVFCLIRFVVGSNCSRNQCS